MSSRAVAPVIGVVLLVAVTVVTAGAVGAVTTVEPPETAPAASFGVAADATGTVELTHRGGDTVSPEGLRVRLRVDGEPLEKQPPVPFFSARGFESGPTGAFNSATTTEWRAGETAALRVAGTNAPSLEEGATLEVRLYAGDAKVAHLETTVQAASTASVSVAASSSPLSSLFSPSSGT